MSDNREKLPGNGFLGWLGRQVGHIGKAIATDVTLPAVPPSKVLYQTSRTEQLPHPTQPGVTLRRTTVDEVVISPPANRSSPN